VRALAPGVYGLSNHLLDEPWPKVTLRAARDAGRDRGAGSGPASFEMLSRHRRARPTCNCRRPAWVSDWERRLSRALITGADYGTRCSTVLAIDPDGTTTFEERTRDAQGAVVSTARHEFALRVAVGS
jgi:uncharacterized protein with NRDE domain